MASEYTTTISSEQAAVLEPDSKIGILSTVGDDGYPHLSFITSLMALDADRIAFGKFCQGYSKRNIEVRPDVAFLSLTPELQWLRGNAAFSHRESNGAVFDLFNAKPLFRYNSYFGFDSVYLMDLVRISTVQRLPMPQIALGAVRSRLAARGLSTSSENKLRHFGKEILGRLDSLKFISWVAADGLLQIVPIVQAGPAGTDRIVCSPTPFGDELDLIPEGAKAAILCVSMQMQSVEAEGLICKRGSNYYLEIERVYNSMPPKTEYIYPRASRPQAVTEF